MWFCRIAARKINAIPEVAASELARTADEVRHTLTHAGSSQT
jgi:hypothetical protein